MKKIPLAFVITFFWCGLYAQQPKIISDCTITYAVTDPDKTEKDTIATSIIYIRGKDIRVDFISHEFSQSIFYNDNSGNATILKIIGKSKYISNYNSDEWKNKNEMYKGVTVSVTGKTKQILNYNCKEAQLTLKNGKVYTVYFIPFLLPSVRENPFEFKDVPGFILEYQLQSGENNKILFTTTSINFNPVPSVQFEIPKTGYRILH